MTPLDVTIERLVPGGVGLARHPDGRVILVRGPLPGDEVSIVTYRDRGGHLEGQQWSLRTPSPDRVDAPCPVAVECGGCDLIHLSPAAQRRAKLGIVQDALRRVGGVQHVPDIEWVASPSPLGYRNRVRLHVRDGRVGFFRQGTHDLVSPPGCPVCEPSVDAHLRRIVAGSRAAPMARNALSGVAELELRCIGSEVRATAVATPGATEAQRVAAQARVGVEVSWTRGVPRSTTPSLDPLALPGGTYTLVPPDGFVQVNRGINDLLVRAVSEGALLRGASTFCDFFSGSGNLALPLLAAGLTGVAVEGRKSSVDAARKAADAQELAGEFIAGEVTRVARRLVQRARGAAPYDLVVVDAPRAGARRLAPSLLDLAPRWIAICSCDPVTLARDLKPLLAGGYAVEAITAFDMFPQTHHVEVLTWLRSSAARGHTSGT